MRAVSVERFGGPEVLVAVDRPDPTAGPGQLLVSVAASDVLWVDTMVRAGRAVDFFPVRPPYVPGNGVAGRVLAAGEGTDPGWVGTQVIAHTGGAGGTGSYAEQAVAAAEEVVALPDGVDPLAALALLHDGATAQRILRAIGIDRAGDRAAAGRPGDGRWALVVGAGGGMGILLLQLLRAAGYRVIGAARGERKLEAAAGAGAEVVVDYGDYGDTGGGDGANNWPARVLAATGGERPEVVLDGAGGRLGATAYQLVAHGGYFSAHGAAGGGFAPVDRADAARRGVTVIGLGDLPVRPGERAGLLRSLLPDLAAGRIVPHVGQTWPLADARAAHTAIEERRAVAKTLLTVN